MSSEGGEKVMLEVRRNEKDTKELYGAAVTGCVSTLDALLRNDALILNEASLTSFCETPLHISSSLGHYHFTRALLHKKPLLATELDSLGRSPLHLASAEGHSDIVKLLVDAAAHVCLVCDRDGRTPLHLAAIRGRVEVIKELVRVRPDSTQVGLAGDSVLHLCVKYYHLEALQALLHLLNGSQLLWLKDSDGNTILHLAVMLNQFKVVSYLASIAEIKSNANALNNIGHTPLDMLEKCPKGFTSLQVEDILVNLGARRRKDLMPPNSPPPPKPSLIAHKRALAKRGNESIIRNSFNSCLRYLTVEVDWITETHGNLMVVATVIATMSFQAAISPPGGVWQEDTTEGPSCSHSAVCKAGTAVLAYGDTKQGYTYFSHRNMVSFIASLSVILLHFGGYPLKNRVGTWLVTIAMCITLTSILVAFSFASALLSPAQRRSDLTLVNLKSSFAHSNPLGVIWIVLLAGVTLTHTIRMAHWLVFDRISSYTWSDKIWFRLTWFKVLVSIVLSVIPSTVIMFAFFA